MKMTRGGSYIKAKDVKNGAIIEILDEGKWEESGKFTYDDGTPQKQLIFSVRYEGEEKQFRMNKASRIAMIDAFGEESKDWIGKTAKIMVMSTPNGNDKMIVLDPIVTEDGKSSGQVAWDEDR